MTNGEAAFCPGTYCTATPTSPTLIKSSEKASTSTPMRTRPDAERTLAESFDALGSWDMRASVSS